MKLLTGTEIRRSCLGEGLYWAGEICETAADPIPVLMPQFRNVAQAQLNSCIEEIKGKREEITKIIDNAITADMVDGRIGSKKYADQIITLLTTT